MKKRGLRRAALFFALVFLAVTLVSAYEQNYTYSNTLSSSIQISSLRYEPYPVEPNEQFQLWIKIQNIGSIGAKDATCRVVPQTPFSVYQGDSEKSYGLLGTGESAVFDFSLKVDGEAVSGENELIVECTDNPASGAWMIKEINIQIQTRYPSLNIVNVKTIPEFVEPGNKAQLLITLENMADSSMKDVSVKPDFSSVSLAPYQEMGEQKLRRIAAGEVKDLIFNIVALPDAQGGIYKVPLTVTFTDDLGMAYSLEGTIAIEINSKPDLEIYVDSSELTKSTKTGNIMFKIVNKGLTDIKFLNIKLLDTQKLDVISGDTIYIGNVDSDDFETAEFRVSVGSNEMVFPIEIEYKDINNKIHSEHLNIAYSLASKSELGQGSGITSWIFLIVIVVVAFIAYRKRKVLVEKVKSFWK
ncbi:MAG: hypothetical protein KKE23_03920 [Nanoarchaeota archaeon]|nr:hypothetical protein [Nanoarchaeota archaeon]